jgi:hypothetical protein
VWIGLRFGSNTSSVIENPVSSTGSTRLTPQTRIASDASGGITSMTPTRISTYLVGDPRLAFRPVVYQDLIGQFQKSSIQSR